MGLLSYWRDMLEEDVLLQGASLAEYTSIRVGGPADVLAIPSHLDRLGMLVRTAHDAGIPVTVLGGGSNVLIRDGGIRGLVILNRCRGYTRLEGDPPRVWVESGMSLAGLARRLIQEGIGGLTWAVSIPGTVGGAVVGNAGAHGGSMADVVEQVTLLHRDGSIENVSGEQMEYGYRTSVVKRQIQEGKGFPVVLGALLRLYPGDADALREEADRYLRYRRQTQPTEPSVGSVFRNPPGDYAGRLIEAAGLKGARVGGAMVSPVHANFIINVGGAMAKDVLALMRLVQERVQEMFDVLLQPEILVLGEERVGTRVRRWEVEE